MLTKTQLGIMGIFASKITERFTIKQISDILKKPYPLIHRSIKGLGENNFIIKDTHGFIFLNYKSNSLELSYVESLRKREFLNKNKTIALFAKDILEKIKLDFFVILIFGSSIAKKKARDVDILFICEKEGINYAEKVLNNISSNFTARFDINVIGVESAYEMLAKRDEANIMNETLDNHILLFGAETYYRILKNAR